MAHQKSNSPSSKNGASNRLIYYSPNTFDNFLHDRKGRTTAYHELSHRQQHEKGDEVFSKANKLHRRAFLNSLSVTAGGLLAMGAGEKVGRWLGTQEEIRNGIKDPENVEWTATKGKLAAGCFAAYAGLEHLDRFLKAYAPLERQFEFDADKRASQYVPLEEIILERFEVMSNYIQTQGKQKDKAKLQHLLDQLDEDFKTQNITDETQKNLIRAIAMSCEFDLNKNVAPEKKGYPSYYERIIDLFKQYAKQPDAQESSLSR